MPRTVSIGGLRYDVIADTTDFEEGMASTAATRRKAAKVIRDTSTAEEKLDKEIKQLNDTLKAGDITLDQYNRAIKKLQENADDAADEVENLGGAFDGMADKQAAFSMAFGTATSIIGEFQNVVGDVREINRYAQELGITADEVQAFGRMARRTGIDQDVMLDGLKELNLRADEAATGVGTAVDTLERFGINVSEYMSAGTVGRFKMIREAISGLTNEATQLREVSEIMGGDGERLLTIFQAGPGIFDENRAAIDRLGASIDDSMTDALKEASSELGDLALRWEGFKRASATAVAGPVGETAEFAGNVAGAARASSFGGISNALRSASGLGNPLGWMHEYNMMFIRMFNDTFGSNQSAQDRQTIALESIDNKMTPTEGV